LGVLDGFTVSHSVHPIGVVVDAIGYELGQVWGVAELGVFTRINEESGRAVSITISGLYAGMVGIE
jgi:hypothetical protein